MDDSQFMDADIVGNSSKLREVLRHAAMVARTDATVLIYGETGTGKESVARAIHSWSDRRTGPLVTLNTAVLQSTLVESELFGHERGAFTGAISRRIGRFESAHRGTLFFDEIGEMDLSMQPKLLRLIQERAFERVGCGETIESDVRLIAATNRDLHAMVEARTFREDLFYRLNVFPIRVPPLRERREDIPILARHFTRRFASRMSRDIRGITPALMERLSAHAWPGNIRELQNVIERAVILTRGHELEAHFDPSESECNERRLHVVSEVVSFADAQRAHILKVLEATDGMVGGPHGAAARLGMKRSTLNFRLKKLGISLQSKRVPRSPAIGTLVLNRPDGRREERPGRVPGGSPIRAPAATPAYPSRASAQPRPTTAERSCAPVASSAKRARTPGQPPS